MNKYQFQNAVALWLVIIVLLGAWFVINHAEEIVALLGGG